jgi:hypothetical protein
MIISLTASVLFCGAIIYLSWFFYRDQDRIPAPWRWLKVNSTAVQSSLAQRDSSSQPTSSFYGRLLAFVGGTCLRGLIFVANLDTYLSPDRRPLTPNVALGYTHLFKAKYGHVFGTYFEYLAITYGIWVTWGGFVLAGLIAVKLKVNREGKRPYQPLLVFAGSAVSVVFCYKIWQACLHIARS